MTKKPKPTPEEAVEQIAGLGSVFRGLGSFVELLGTMVEQGEALKKQGNFTPKGLGDGAQGVYGFSIRSGLGGAPQVRRFGNVQPTANGPVVSDVREPLVDVFDEGTEIMITAELPGVADADISLTLDGDVLSLETAGKRRYAKEIALPAPVDPASLTRSHRNGILQIQLKKK